MAQKKNAYKILGLKEGAGKDQISLRYTILLKKYRSKLVRGEDTAAKDITIEDITKAYNTLMGYDDIEPDAETLKLRELKDKGIFKRFNLDPEKMSNFWTYHKMHIIFGIIAVLVVYSIISSIVNKVEPDFTLGIVGDIYATNSEAVVDAIETVIPALKEVSVMPMSVKMTAENEFDIAIQQKIMIEMAVGDLDLVIVDKWNYDRFADSGTFMELSDVAKELDIDMEAHEELITELDESVGEVGEGLYGIYVTDSEFLKECGIIGGEMIVVIRVTAKHPEAAMELLKIIVK